MSPNSMNQFTASVFVDASREARREPPRRSKSKVFNAIADQCKEELPNPPAGYKTPEVADLETIHRYAVQLKRANRRMTRRQLRQALAEKFDVKIITSWDEVLNN